jgi:hypothetical protein
MLRNRLILTGLIVAGLTGLAMAKTAINPAETETTPEANEPAGQITFEKVIHDFGEIRPGSKNVCEFKFTNTGKGMLKIKNVTRTCGCTPFTLAKKEYNAGESGTLKVRFLADKLPGVTTKRLYVHSNDKTNPRVELVVKAEIIPKVNYEPKRLNLSLKQENAGCPKITLESRDKKPFSIKQFKAINDCITANFEPQTKAKTFVLHPKVNMEKLRNTLRGSVNIGLTHPECNAISIPFEALPEFATTPSTIIVFKAEPQKPVERELWVLNNYGEEFEIESAASKEGIIKVSSQKKVDTGDRYKLELQITPPPPTGTTRMFKDVLLVKIKGGEKLEIACHGVYAREAVKSSSQ